MVKLPIKHEELLLWLAGVLGWIIGDITGGRSYTDPVNVLRLIIFPILITMLFIGTSRLAEKLFS